MVKICFVYTIQYLLFLLNFFQVSFSNVQVYSDWSTCVSYECYDEYNECTDSQRPWSSLSCKTQANTFKTCALACNGVKACIEQCGAGLTEPIAKGYKNCWLYCYDDFAEFSRQQPQNSDFAELYYLMKYNCLTQTFECNAITGCPQFNQTLNKEFYQCVFETGKYDHYTDYYIMLEIQIIQKCMSQTYIKMYDPTKIETLQASYQLLQCYLDCTTMETGIAKLKYSFETLEDLQICTMYGECSQYSTVGCQGYTCQGPGLGLSQCLRFIELTNNPSYPLSVAIDFCLSDQYHMKFMTDEYSQCVKNKCGTEDKQQMKNTNFSILLLLIMLLLYICLIYQ